MPSQRLGNRSTRSTTSGGPGLKITAALLGGFFATVALTVAITMIWPFGDRIEQIFAGGIFFFVLWSFSFYWALLARSAAIAWLRVGSLIVIFGLLDVYFLVLGHSS